MAAQTWVITDVDQNLHVSELSLTAADIQDAPAAFSVSKTTLRGGLSDGVEMIHVDNGKLKFGILLTRGMSLTTASLNDVDFGWQSPVAGPVHPKFVPLNEPSGLGWLDGFNEMMVRCGLESNGAPEFDSETNNLQYPLHGRIGNKPAQKVSITIDSENQLVTIQGTVLETRFHFFKLALETTITTRFNDHGLEIQDTVHNLSASPAEAQMLYHCNFGVPLLDAGSQVIAAIRELVPRNDHAAASVGSWSSYEAPQAGFEEQVYFLKLLGDSTGETEVLLKNAHSTQGVGLAYNVNQLPCFSVWKNTTAVEDGYVTGIEPGTNYPNPRSYEGEQGRVLKLGPKGSAELKLGIRFLTAPSEIAASQQRIEELQSTAKPIIHSKPQPGWCAP